MHDERCGEFFTEKKNPLIDAWNVKKFNQAENEKV